jgi:Tfp pilus assembly protein PilN
MKAVNLLPPDLRGAGTPASAVGSADASVGRAGALGVLGALAFCVLALAAYVLTTNTIKDRQAELDQVTAQAASVTQHAAQLKPFADFQAQAAQRVATVRDLASARFDWEQALRDISRAVPGNVTLTSLTGTVSAENGSGGSSARAAIAAPAIELKGCTTGQRAVADLLSRLRTVDGVSRVSLSKSDRPEVAATASSSGASAVPGCPSGRPPSFEIVVFFEYDKVPATVQDVTVAPASTTAAPTTSTTASTSGTQPGATSTATPSPTPASTTTG